MIRNWYLDELSNDIPFLEDLKEIGWTYRVFFPFLTEARQQLFYKIFGQKDGWAQGITQEELKNICDKAGVACPILVNRQVHDRKDMGENQDHPADLINYDFSADHPYHKFCIGIGQYDTRDEDKIYMGVLLDLYDRSVAAITFSTEIDMDIADALIQRVADYSVRSDLVVHSSHKQYYTSMEYHDVCEVYHVTMSMTQPGTRGAIMPISTFFSEIKRKMGDYQFTDMQDARDWLSVYLMRYNVEKILKGYE